MQKHVPGLVALLAALALGGCTETFVGYRAEFASNTLAVRARPPGGERLHLQVPKHTTDLSRRTVYLVPRGAVLHLRGFLPVTPDGVDDAGDHWVVRITVPHDVVKATRGPAENGPRVYGELYIPAEVGVRSFTGVELREPAATRTVSASLSAVYRGPMSSAAKAVGDFLRGLYSAR